MNRERPFITIITVVLNDAANIQATIQSVINQTCFDKVEYVLIDGLSTDGTLDIIKQFEAKIDVLVSEKDVGIYDAMNKGLNRASGEYVLFINSGDTIMNEDTVASVFDKINEADVFYGETILSDSNSMLGTRSELTSRKLPDHLTPNDFLKGMVVSHQSFIARRDLCEPFLTKYQCSADIDWCITILKKCREIINGDMIISNFKIGGFSNRYRKTCWMERFNIMIKHYGIYRAFITHIFIILRYFIRILSGQPNYT